MVEGLKAERNKTVERLTIKNKDLLKQIYYLKSTSLMSKNRIDDLMKQVHNQTVTD